MNLLLAEDDPELARQIIAWMSEAGHQTKWCENGKDTLAAQESGVFDAIILDVGLPDMDGFTVVEKLRAAQQTVPVLFLTARDSVTDRVRGLKAGGDDYLTKPFAVEELLARLEVMHRRNANIASPTARTLGSWTIDGIQRRLRKGAEVVELQPREWMLLEVFLKNEGRMLTKKYLLEKVWDVHFDPGTNVVDAMVCRLRRKIDTPDQPSFVRTVRGKGYVFSNLS